MPKKKKQTSVSALVVDSTVNDKVNKEEKTREVADRRMYHIS